MTADVNRRMGWQTICYRLSPAPWPVFINSYIGITTPIHVCIVSAWFCATPSAMRDCGLQSLRYRKSLLSPTVENRKKKKKPMKPKADLLKLIKSMNL